MVPRLEILKIHLAKVAVFNNFLKYMGKKIKIVLVFRVTEEFKKSKYLVDHLFIVTNVKIRLVLTDIRQKDINSPLYAKYKICNKTNKKNPGASNS